VMFGKIDLEVLYSIKPILFSMVLLTCHFSSELLLSIQPFFFFNSSFLQNISHYGRVSKV
jgi:hypothetical protein